MPIDHVLRVLERTVRAQRGPLTVLALAAIALGALGTTDALTRVSRTQEEKILDAWREEGAFTYRVPVDPRADAYPEGTVLPMGEPGYLTPVGPRVLFEFSWRALDPPQRIAQASLDVAAHAQGIGVAEKEWHVQIPLAHAGSEGDEAGTLLAGGTLDWAQLDTATAQAARQDVPTTAWRVLATVRYTMEGDPTPRVSEFVFPVRYERPLYVLPTEADARHERDHGERVVTVHEAPARPADLLRTPRPLLALAGGAGLLLLVAGLGGRTRPTQKEAVP